MDSLCMECEEVPASRDDHDDVDAKMTENGSDHGDQMDNEESMDIDESNGEDGNSSEKKPASLHITSVCSLAAEDQESGGNSVVNPQPQQNPVVSPAHNASTAAQVLPSAPPSHTFLIPLSLVNSTTPVTVTLSSTLPRAAQNTAVNTVIPLIQNNAVGAGIIPQASSLLSQAALYAQQSILSTSTLGEPQVLTAAPLLGQSRIVAPSSFILNNSSGDQVPKRLNIKFNVSQSPTNSSSSVVRNVNKSMKNISRLLAAAPLNEEIDNKSQAAPLKSGNINKGHIPSILLRRKSPGKVNSSVNESENISTGLVNTESVPKDLPKSVKVEGQNHAVTENKEKPTKTAEEDAGSQSHSLVSSSEQEQQNDPEPSESSSSNHSVASFELKPKPVKKDSRATKAGETEQSSDPMLTTFITSTKHSPNRPRRLSSLVPPESNTALNDTMKMDITKSDSPLNGLLALLSYGLPTLDNEATNPKGSLSIAGLALKAQSSPTLKRYWCNFCDFTCYQSKEFVHHLSSHMFKCAKCSFKAYTRTEILLHIKSVHGGFNQEISKFEICKIGELSKKDQLTRTPKAAVTRKHRSLNDIGKTTAQKEDSSSDQPLKEEIKIESEEKPKVGEVDLDRPGIPLVSEKMVMSKHGTLIHKYWWQCSRCKQTFNTSEDFKSHSLDKDGGTVNCEPRLWYKVAGPLSKKDSDIQILRSEVKTDDQTKDRSSMHEGDSENKTVKEHGKGSKYDISKMQKSDEFQVASTKSRGTSYFLPDGTEVYSKYDYNIAMMKMNERVMASSVSDVMADSSLPIHPCPYCPVSFADKKSFTQHLVADHPEHDLTAVGLTSAGGSLRGSFGADVTKTHTLLNPCVARFIEIHGDRYNISSADQLQPKVGLDQLKLKNKDAKTVRLTYKSTHTKKPFSRSKYPQLFKCRYCLLVFAEWSKCKEHCMEMHRNLDVIAIDLKAFKLKKAMNLNMCKTCSFKTYKRSNFLNHVCRGRNSRVVPEENKNAVNVMTKSPKLQHVNQKGNKSHPAVKKSGEKEEKSKILKRSKPLIYEVKKIPLKLQKVLKEQNLLNGKKINLNFVSRLLVCNHCNHVNTSVPDMKTHLVDLHPFKPLIAWDFKARLQRQTNSIYYCPGKDCKFVTYALEAIHKHRSDNTECPITDVPPSDWGLKRVRYIPPNPSRQQGSVDSNNEASAESIVKRFRCRHCKFVSETVAVAKEHCMLHHAGRQLIFRDLKRQSLKQKNLVYCCPKPGCEFWCYGPVSAVLFQHACPMPFGRPPPISGNQSAVATISSVYSHAAIKQEPVEEPLIEYDDAEADIFNVDAQEERKPSLLDASNNINPVYNVSSANSVGLVSSIYPNAVSSVSTNQEVGRLLNMPDGAEEDDDDEEDDSGAEEGAVTSNEVFRCSNCSFSSCSLADMREHLLYQHTGPQPSSSLNGQASAAANTTAQTRPAPSSNPQVDGREKMYHCTKCTFMTTIHNMISLHVESEHAEDVGYRVVSTTLGQDGNMMVNVTDRSMNGSLAGAVHALTPTPVSSLAAALGIKKET